MNIENILKNIAQDKGKTPEGVKESNVDDVFEKGGMEDGLYYACLTQLFEYVKKDLGKDYHFEDEDPFRADDITAPDLLEIYLIKTLKNNRVYGEISIEENHTIKAEVMTLDLCYMCDLDELTDLDSFFADSPRKVGNILDKIKNVYDEIENYS